MKWLTWEGVGVDRMASAWLIVRKIDPEPEFVFIPAGTAAPPEGGEAFDIPGARYSHHRGHCSFHALLKAHDCRDPVLDRIAAIVDEADSVQEVLLEPAAYGLDLLCRGIRRTSENDHEALRRGAELYDALYAELAAETTASQSDSHVAQGGQE